MDNDQTEDSSLEDNMAAPLRQQWTVIKGGNPVKVFAVTLEPERGVPAPTGPTVLASAK